MRGPGLDRSIAEEPEKVPGDSAVGTYSARLEVGLEALQVAIDEFRELDRIGVGLAVRDAPLELECRSKVGPCALALPPAASLPPNVVGITALEDAIGKLGVVQQLRAKLGVHSQRSVEIGSGALFDPLPIVAIPDDVPVTALV
jgi:hypothetical protein